MRLRPSDVAALLVSGVILMGAGTATALPFAPADVRAAGMGGTGVASARSASAGLFNPALLSAQRESDSFQFALGAGVLAADEDELFDQTDAIGFRFDALDAALAANNVVNIGSESSALVQQLNAINNDDLLLGASAGVGVGVPKASLGFGVTVSANAHVDAAPRLGATDIGALLDLADNGQMDDPQYAAKVAGNTFQTDSTAESTGIIVSEIAVALSHRLELASGAVLALGITPKAVDVTTYRYEERIDNFNDNNIDSANVEKVDSHVDLDVGAVYRPTADSLWQYGITAHNLADQSYTTVATLYSPPRRITVNTQLRVGAARLTERSTLAIDLDLLENDGVAADGATQFLALGAEYDLKYLQLRAGYRANLANSDVADVASAGLGLGPVDITAVAGGNTLGAYLNIGFGW